MPRPSPSVIVLLLITVLSLLSAACNGDDGTSPTPGAPVPSPTLTPGATDTPSLAPFQGSREPVEVVTNSVPTPILVDVAAARHEDFDRIVFEFDLSRPGYRVEYVPEAIACGSGMTVSIAGSAFLQVRMTPAVAHDDAGAPTFASQEITPALPAIIEGKQTCDFEGDVTWVLGLTEEADFVVSTFPDPFRVVVDVGHP